MRHRVGHPAMQTCGMDPMGAFDGDDAAEHGVIRHMMVP